MNELFQSKKDEILKASVIALKCSRKNIILFAVIPVIVLIAMAMIKPEAALFFVIIWAVGVFFSFLFTAIGGGDSFLITKLEPIDYFVQTSRNYGLIGNSSYLIWRTFQGVFVFGFIFIIPNVIVLPVIHVFLRRLYAKIQNSTLSDDEYQNRYSEYLLKSVNKGIFNKIILGVSFCALPIILIGGFYGIKHGATFFVASGFMNKHVYDAVPKGEVESFKRLEIDKLKPIREIMEPEFNKVMADGKMTYEEKHMLEEKLTQTTKKLYGSAFANEKTPLLSEKQK